MSIKEKAKALLLEIESSRYQPNGTQIEDSELAEELAQMRDAVAETLAEYGYSFPKRKIANDAKTA